MLSRHRQGSRAIADLLFRKTLRGAAEEDHRRLLSFAQSEKSAEVGICRDYDPAFAPGSIENPRVVCRLHPVVAYMRSVMSRVAQAFGDTWRERIIDEKSQEAERNGNSRSRTASAA